MMNDKFAAVRNHEFKETEGINSVQSSLKSHSLWVTLYINYTLFWFAKLKSFEKFSLSTSEKF